MTETFYRLHFAGPILWERCETDGRCSWSEFKLTDEARAGLTIPTRSWCGLLGHGKPERVAGTRLQICNCCGDRL